MTISLSLLLFISEFLLRFSGTAFLSSVDRDKVFFWNEKLPINVTFCSARIASLSNYVCIFSSYNRSNLLLFLRLKNHLYFIHSLLRVVITATLDYDKNDL